MVTLLSDSRTLKGNIHLLKLSNSKTTNKQISESQQTLREVPNNLFDLKILQWEFAQEFHCTAKSELM